MPFQEAREGNNERHNIPLRKQRVIENVCEIRGKQNDIQAGGQVK